MRPIIFLVIGGLASPFTMAQYRCVENGKPLFTDKPCGNSEIAGPARGNSPKIIGDSTNSAYSTGYGDWRGQVQYQATFKGHPVAEAHAVVQTTLSIDPQGKILGSSPENGCKMNGIASPGIGQTILNLDITLTGCTFSKLNRRLTGHWRSTLLKNAPSSGSMPTPLICSIPAGATTSKAHYVDDDLA